MSPLPIIAVVNLSTLLEQDAVTRAVDAIQKQVSGEFGRAWSLDATLAALGPHDTPPAGAWIVRLVDDCDAPDALGYHEDTGTPSGIVGVKTCNADGVPWSSTLSHEVLEMRVDPWAILCAYAGQTIRALEVSDPCEEARYQIDGVTVSDFVYPAWFMPGAPGPYDHLGVISAPLKLASGGYIQAAPSGSWSQMNGEQVRASKRIAAPWSRRGRRAWRA